MLLILIVPIIIFLFKGLLLQEFLIGTFYIHFGHDKSNNKSNHHRNPKIHNLKHLNTGITLHRQCSVKTTEVQKPVMAIPIPPPNLIPREVQEYMVPSTLFFFVRYVYSEQEAITAFISPCHGPIPKAAIPVNKSINGTLPR